MSAEDAIVIASEAGVSIKTIGDISEILADCIGKQGLILSEKELARDFFDLRTGLAGELFQKFINYKIKVAIVVQDTQAYGERFAELAYEHKSHNMIRVVGSEDEAKGWLGA